MNKEDKIELQKLKRDYIEQGKIAKRYKVEAERIKRKLLEELTYQEAIDSKEYRQANFKYVAEQRKAVGLEVVFIKRREELMKKE